MTAAPATGNKIARGAAWMVGFKLLDKAIGLASIIVLARVLTPGDFGLVAMATSVVALLELMGAFGFDNALIQRQDAQRRHFDTAWTFNVLFGVAIAVLLVALAVPSAGFYREPRLELMLPVLAIGALVGGFENVGTVAFRKELDFGMEFRFLLAKRLASVAITIPLALVYRTFWALIAGIVAGKVIAVLISYRLHPYRPRLTLEARADLLHFSKWLFLFNVVQFLHARSTDFILGRVVGSHGLGTYKMATEIAAMPSSEMIAPLNRAVYPAYAQLANDRDKLSQRFLEVFGVINLLAFPVAVGLFCVAHLLVALMLGPQWREAVPVMQIAGLAGLLSALWSNMYYVLLALGKPKPNTLLQAGLLIVYLPAVVLASLHFGIVGAAYAQLVVATIGFAGIVTLFSRVAGLGPGPLFAVMWRPLLASVVMVPALGVAQDVLATQWGITRAAAQLAIVVPAGAVVYSATMLALWALCGRPAGTERSVLAFLRGRLAGLGRSG